MPLAAERPSANDAEVTAKSKPPSALFGLLLSVGVATAGETWPSLRRLSDCESPRALAAISHAGSQAIPFD